MYIFCGVLFITFIALIIDWLDLSFMVSVINILSAKLMLSEWISYIGFIVALAVPTLFYLQSEHNRKIDSKKAKEQRILDIKKQEEEFEFVNNQNEKQFICNVITNYKTLEWNNNLIDILYSNEAKETKDTKLIIYKYAYLRFQHENAKELFTRLEKEKIVHNVKTLNKDNSKNYNRALYTIFAKNKEEVKLVNLIEQLVTDEEKKK